MRARLATGALVLLLLLVLVFGRPYGDRLLASLSGGTTPGAVLLGTALWLVPVAVATAYLLPRFRQLSAGAEEREVRGPRVLGAAFWVAFLPVMTLPVLGSRSASDTPLEQSSLFPALLAGFFTGLALAAAGLALLMRRRAAAVRAGEQMRRERWAASAAAAHPATRGPQTPDRVRRRRRGR